MGGLRYFSRGATSTFCSSFSSYLRYNAKWRSQNASPFLPVTAWLESTARLESRFFGDSDSTQVTLKTTVIQIESRSSQIDSTRVAINNSNESHFYKTSEPLMDKPSLFAHNEMSSFASVMIKVGANILFWFSSRVMLHFKDQAFPTCTRIDVSLCFSLRGQQRTIYWQIIVI